MTESTDSGDARAGGTLVLVAAGPRIGLATARRFGREGFHAALISRSRDNLDALVAELSEDGVEASGHVADVSDPAALEAALAAVREAHGPVDVLVYNGAGARHGLTASPDVTRESARDAFEVTVLGAVTAVRAVLPAMLERGSGTLLFTSGLSAVHPFAFLGNVGVAAAGMRNYALGLAEALAGQGVHVGHLPIGARVEQGSPASPETVAETHWRFHAERTTHEAVLGSVDLVKQAIAQITAG